MIRNVILHLLNEQPLLVDLPALPAAGDTCLRCGNVRTTSGVPPVWVANGGSEIVFPLAQVRFLEVPPAGDLGSPSVPGSRGEEAAWGPELELDEELLRRIRES